MNKKDTFRNIMFCFFSIGAGVQILLGIWWLFSNLGSFQEFGDSYYFMDISKTLICDEYTGILYPLLIRFAMWIEGMIRTPFYIVIYIVQLTAAFFSSMLFILGSGIAQWKEGEKRWCIFGALYLLTIPMNMQLHLAVLPNSFLTSFLFTQIALVLSIGKITDRKKIWYRYIMLALLWGGCALLRPEYAIIAGVPFLLAVLRTMGSGKKRMYSLGIFVVAGIFVIVTMGVTQTEGSQGKVHKSIQASMVSRFVWPDLIKNRVTWPEEIQQAIGEEEVWEISLYGDQMFSRFGPLVEETVGVKEAKKYFMEMTASSLEFRKRSIFRAITIDALSYSMAPISLWADMKGMDLGRNYSARNYEIMKQQKPLLTKYYVRYGNIWFGIGILIAALMSLGKCIVGAKGEKKECFSIGLLLGMALILITYYTMAGAGMMDYKNVVFITGLWYCWMYRVQMGMKLK